MRTCGCTPQGVSSGSYTAMATVAVEAEVYGPRTREFEVAYNLCYLPSVVKNAHPGTGHILYLPLILKGYGES